MNNLDKLVMELIRYPKETQWLEFKHNKYTPDMIGEDISALANSAALYDKNQAYMLWGIDDETHEILGTQFDMQKEKKGNQELESWLRELLSKNVYFEFHTVEINGLNVGILIIDRAITHTVTFKKIDYIRIGSYTKKLHDYSAVQTQLWDKITNTKFEEKYAKQDLSLHEALNLLDYSIYFDILGEPMPSTTENIGHYMEEENIIKKLDNGLFAITNMGAMLFAKRLSDFSRISRKAVRVVQYEGNGRIHMLREDVGNKGYVIGFEGLIKYIEALVPSDEIIDGALRRKKNAYPLLAIREAVANALIHQDFTIVGTGPIVEIFSNRIEITNPGIPLVDIKRIVDNPAKSRNEKLAGMMRKMRMCEELGTGWDKIVLSCELQKLPAPRIDLYEENTKVTLFSYVPYSNISQADKLWACYLHACVKYVQIDYLTNSSLRDRFGLKDSASGSISRLIKEAVNQHIIKPYDPDTAPRYMKYMPIWG